MTIEAATVLGQLDPTLPAPEDQIPEGDDHIRLIKRVLRATFPGMGRPLGTCIIAGANTALATTDNQVTVIVAGASVITLPALSGLAAFDCVIVARNACTIAASGADKFPGDVASVALAAGQCLWAFNSGTTWEALRMLRSNAPVAADTAVNATNAQNSQNAVNADKLIPQGTAGYVYTSQGGGANPTWAAPPSAPVSSVFGRTGAVALTLADITNAGGASASSVVGKADASHSHSYAPMTAVVSIVKYQDADTRYIRYTRANGAVVDVPFVGLA